MRRECEKLAHSLQKYAQMLQEKNNFMKIVHSSPTPWRSIAKKLPLELIEIGSRWQKYVHLYYKVNLHSYLPINPQKRYLLTKKVKQEGIEVPSVLLVYSTGNNCGNCYFMWPVPDSWLDQVLANSQGIIEDIKQSLPTHYTCAMHSEKLAILDLQSSLLSSGTSTKTSQVTLVAVKHLTRNKLMREWCKHLKWKIQTSH